MELLGFSKWKSINESDNMIYYRFNFKDPREDQSERAELIRTIVDRECKKLFPSYNSEIKLDSARITITFTIKEDDFSLFSDTGAAEPFTLVLDTVILRFSSGVKQQAIKKLENFGKVFKQPKTSKDDIVLVAIGPNTTIDSVIDMAAISIQTKQPFYRYKKVVIPEPTEDMLDKIIFTPAAEQPTWLIREFNQILSDSISYLYIKEYINSAFTGTSIPEVTSAKEIDKILTLKSDGKSASESIDKLTQIIPVLHKLYYESVYQRVESKDASELFAKAMIHLIEEFGNTEELFSVINKLVRANNISNNSF